MEYKFDYLKEKYKNLPEDVRDAVSSVEVSEKLQIIGGKHGLLVDKIGVLVDETGFVLLGINPTKDYIRNLSKGLSVDKETVSKIAKDVNEEIFKPVRESLKEMSREEETTPPVPQKTTEKEDSVVPHPLPREESVKKEPEAIIITPKPQPTDTPKDLPIKPPTQPTQEEIPQKPRGGVLGEKLTGIVQLSKENTHYKTEKKKVGEGSQEKYTVDPYREAID